jgi:hypothetical protein
VAIGSPTLTSCSAVVVFGSGPSSTIRRRRITFGSAGPGRREQGHPSHGEDACRDPVHGRGCHSWAAARPALAWARPPRTRRRRRPGWRCRAGRAGTEQRPGLQVAGSGGRGSTALAPSTATRKRHSTLRLRPASMPSYWPRPCWLGTLGRGVGAHVVPTPPHVVRGGGCEIRTREGLPPTRFPSVRPRPTRRILRRTRYLLGRREAFALAPDRSRTYSG